MPTKGIKMAGPLWRALKFKFLTPFKVRIENNVGFKGLSLSKDLLFEYILLIRYCPSPYFAVFIFIEGGGA